MDTFVESGQKAVAFYKKKGLRIRKIGTKNKAVKKREFLNSLTFITV